jgi:hypothetical protein
MGLKMLDLLSRKASSGDLYVNMAQGHLQKHEWGMAKISVERALAKGALSEPGRARELLQDACARLAVDFTTRQ